jgi:hypothetical protein
MCIKLLGLTFLHICVQSLPTELKHNSLKRFVEALFQKHFRHFDISIILIIFETRGQVVGEKISSHSLTFRNFLILLLNK